MYKQPLTISSFSQQVRPSSSYSTSRLRGPLATKSHYQGAAGGHIGLLWPSFMSGPNLAPAFAYHWVMEYPTISGITKVNSKCIIDSSQ